MKNNIEGGEFEELDEIRGRGEVTEGNSFALDYRGIDATKEGEAIKKHQEGFKIPELRPNSKALEKKRDEYLLMAIHDSKKDFKRLILGDDSVLEDTTGGRLMSKVVYLADKIPGQKFTNPNAESHLLNNAIKLVINRLYKEHGIDKPENASAREDHRQREMSDTYGSFYGDKLILKSLAEWAPSPIRELAEKELKGKK